MADGWGDRAATFDVLVSGSTTATGGKVVSTCTLLRDAEHAIVVDPGMVDDSGAILTPLGALGLAPEDVTEVILSHHHPDHTLRAGLFPNAAVHDHWAIYRGSAWEDAEAEGRRISNSVSLIRVPGHTAQDIATVASTSDGDRRFARLSRRRDESVTVAQRSLRKASSLRRFPMGRRSRDGIGCGSG